MDENIGTIEKSLNNALPLEEIFSRQESLIEKRGDGLADLLKNLRSGCGNNEDEKKQHNI